MLLSAAALACLIGCKNKQEGEPAPPKYNELFTPSRPVTQGTPAQIIIHRAEVPHNADINAAWTLTTTRGIDPFDVTTWQANGFRIGRLKRERLEQFFAMLPPRDHDDRTVQMTVPTDKEMDPEPIIIADGQAPRRSVTYFLPPDTLRTEPLPRGRYQFLLTARELTQTPGMAIQIIPHLYYPEFMLRPKPPNESRLNGRVFRQLTLNSIIEPDELFVIAIDIPVKLPPNRRITANQPISTQPADTQPQHDSPPGTNPNDPGPADPLGVGSDLPVESKPLKPTQIVELEEEWKLADLVLGLQRFGVAYQAILLFEPIPSAYTHPAPATTPSTQNQPPNKPMQ